MIFLNLIEANKIITSKLTNARCNSLKEEAWKIVTLKFNNSISSYPRTTEQLKLKWDNLKKSVRKRIHNLKVIYIFLFFLIISNLQYSNSNPVSLDFSFNKFLVCEFCNSWDLLHLLHLLWIKVFNIFLFTIIFHNIYDRFLIANMNLKFVVY